MEQNTGLFVALMLVAIAVLMQAGTMLGIWLANQLEPPCTHGGEAGSAGDCRPDADLTVHSEITSVWATMQDLRDFGLHNGVYLPGFGRHPRAQRKVLRVRNATGFRFGESSRILRQLIRSCPNASLRRTCPLILQVLDPWAYSLSENW